MDKVTPAEDKSPGFVFDKKTPAVLIVDDNNMNITAMYGLL